MTQLIVNELTCERYPRQLFAGVSFTLMPGECLTIVGTNGLGKSSLLKLLAGLSTPAAGTVHFNAPLAYVGHQQGIQMGLSPLENGQYTQLLQGCQTDLSAVQTYLKTVALPSRVWYQPSSTLSQGQLKRLALALLLIKKATLWLLDEPYAALDEAGQLLVNTLLRQHLQAGGLCVLTAHHPAAAPYPDYLDLAQYAKT